MVIKSASTTCYYFTLNQPPCSQGATTRTQRSYSYQFLWFQIDILAPEQHAMDSKLGRQETKAVKRSHDDPRTNDRKKW